MTAWPQRLRGVRKARFPMRHTSDRENARQPAAARSGALPIDHTVLDRLLSDDQEAVGVVLRQFRVSCPGDASALGAALSRNDSKGALRWAHRLKGACQMVGATRLAELCGRIEVAVRAGDTGRVNEAVSDIDVEAERITEYLDTWLKASA
jgi:HPt (histidine-containing phosphotransfer) domain-containing protein